MTETASAESPRVSIAPSRRAQRKDQFRKLGAALTELETAWAVRKLDFQFEIRPRVVQSEEVSSRLYGPQMRTQQFVATVFLEKN